MIPKNKKEKVIPSPSGKLGRSQIAFRVANIWGPRKKKERYQLWTKGFVFSNSFHEESRYLWDPFWVCCRRSWSVSCERRRAAELSRLSQFTLTPAAFTVCLPSTLETRFAKSHDLFKLFNVRNWVNGISQTRDWTQCSYYICSAFGWASKWSAVFA